MDALADEYGYELGEQQRAWWAWHDGAERRDDTRDTDLWVKPYSTLFSLREALDFAAEAKTWNPTANELPMAWDPTWLPFLRGGGEWVSRTASPGGPSAVTDSKIFPIGEYYATDSIEHFVDIWCWGIDHGVLVLEAGVWENRAGLVPVPEIFDVMGIF